MTAPETAGLGEQIYQLGERLFPLPRSISGDGVRQTYEILRAVVPELTTYEVPTGERHFDWVIPNEWNVSDAYIATLDGVRVIDWKVNNLHLVGYSIPVDKVVTRAELMEHVQVREDVRNAIPYITSYYVPRWGFCMTAEQRDALRDDAYRVVVDSRLEPGSLTCGEILVPGESTDEILIHTYTCHPSLANNETSGMAVTAYLARYVLDLPHRRYSYRIVFVPETIGAIAYISRNLEALRTNVRAGFVVTCVGDDRCYSLLPSRRSGTLPERVARHVFDRVLQVPHKDYSFQDRGSDERQYCAPGIDLPVVSMMRSKYGEYPEYHSSLDDLTVISPAGLGGGYTAIKTAIDVLEANETLVATVLGEPWLSPRGLRPPTIDGKYLVRWSALLSHVLAYADGEHDLLAMAELLGIPIFDLVPIVQMLKEQNLVKVHSPDA